MNAKHEMEVAVRQRELMKQAENARLANMARKKPRKVYLLFARLAQQVVTVMGNRLKGQTEPRPIEAGRRLKPGW